MSDEIEKPTGGENEFKPNKKEIELSPEQMKELWQTELKNSNAVHDFLKEYDPEKLDNFFKEYAQNKWYWITSGNRYFEEKKREEASWIEWAFEQMEIIQSKKLFDLQCMWRAEQVELAEIEISYDFVLLSENILNCHFIDPVSWQDIVMYIDFLHTTDHFHFMQTHDIRLGQDYTDIKASILHDEEDDLDEDVEGFTNYYEFHNMRTGNGQLLILPNVRGDKEEAYRHAYFQSKEVPETSSTTRHFYPYLGVYDKELMAEFVKKFESPEVFNYYQHFINRPDLYDDTLGDDIDFLLQLPYDAPIEANTSWSEAVRRAAHKVRIQNVIDVFPQAYDQYCLTKNLGLSFSLPNKESHTSSHIRDLIAEQILNGREALGEPRDFDF